MRKASSPCSQRSVTGCRRSCVVVRADHFRLSSSSSSVGARQHASIRAFDPTTSYAATQAPASARQQGGFALPLVAAGMALVGVAAILYKKMTGRGCASEAGTFATCTRQAPGVCGASSCKEEVGLRLQARLHVQVTERLGSKGLHGESWPRRRAVPRWAAPYAVALAGLSTWRSPIRASLACVGVLAAMHARDGPVGNACMHASI